MYGRLVEYEAEIGRRYRSTVAEPAGARRAVLLRAGELARQAMTRAARQRAA